MTMTNIVPWHIADKQGFVDSQHSTFTSRKEQESPDIIVR